MRMDGSSSSTGSSGSAVDSPTAGLSRWRKTRRWLADYKWVLVGIVWLGVLVLGYLGFSRYFSDMGETSSISDRLYRSLQLFVLDSGSIPGPLNWQLEVARLLAPAVAVYTVIQALAVILREQFHLLRARFSRNHVVICGLGRKGFLLTRGFLGASEHVLVIEQDPANGFIERCRELGAIVMIGNAADSDLLRKAQVRNAKHVIAVCGDDGANSEVAVHARELVENRKGRALLCLVHIMDSQLCDLLREREMELGKIDAFRLEFFNVFESGAAILLSQHPPFDMIVQPDGRMPHVVVVGLGRMGQSLVVNAAKAWRYRDDWPSQRLRMTLIDREADERVESLLVRYPSLDHVAEMEPMHMDIRDPRFERGEFLFDQSGDNPTVTIAYVCLDDDSNALAAALTLNRCLGDARVPIVVRMTHEKGLATLLQGDQREHSHFVDIHAFGVLDHVCDPDVVLRGTYEILARAIHEDYIRAQREIGETPETNPSIKSWDDLSENLRESNRRVAEHIRVKIEAIGCDMATATDWDAQPFEFTPEELETLAIMEHKRWAEEKLSEGYRPGTQKDDQAKTHPCLVEWADLPEDEKDKDRDQVCGIPEFLALVGLEIRRPK